MNIVINNKKYRAPHSCETLSIKQFQIITEWNNKIKNFETLKQIQKDNDTAIFLEKICSVERKIALKTKIDDRIEFIKKYLIQINKIFENWTPKQNKNKTETYKSFTWQGNKMLLPLNNTNFEGQKMPMAYISAIELCEATDLYISDAVKYAPLIVAILCRKKNEKYNEKITEERAKNMYNISMETLWEIYNQLNQTHQYLREIFPNCYQKKINKQPEKYNSKKISNTWNELIITLANHKPSEIQNIEKLNAYNFMRILNSKLKST